MHRGLTLIIALLASGAAAGPAVAAPTPPKLAAKLQTCSTSPLPVNRVASFTGSMPARTHAPRMRMRFDLERRRPGDRRWRRLRAAGFGVWQRARPNVAGLVITKRVNGLPVPASYRALVRFRWLDRHGAVVDEARARTKACRQPDLRPDLQAGALSATLDLQPGFALYTVVVRNAGRSPAGPSSVRLGSGSAELEDLQPGEERAVGIVAIACDPGAPVTVRVDADGRIDEADERDNAVQKPCPLSFG